MGRKLTAIGCPVKVKCHSIDLILDQGFSFSIQINKFEIVAIGQEQFVAANISRTCIGLAAMTVVDGYIAARTSTFVGP